MSENIKTENTNKLNAVVVKSGKTARELLRKGFVIIDLKPHKNDKNKTVFVFREENNIRQLIADLEKDK